jgi:uncharacterized protein (DUF433 family)
MSGQAARFFRRGEVSGAWVFRGTRMPVATVFENLEVGASIDEIMEWFDYRSAEFCREEP